MNAFGLLKLQESIEQYGAGKHDQWGGYMTALVFNDGIIKSISILTAVIRPMIQFDVDTPRACFRQEVQWTLASCSQFSTLSALDSDRIHHIPDAPLLEKDAYCLPEGNQ
jgi:hypothetical protein